ncbi:Pyridoxal-dependent decarboxylase [Candidatus Koribacter versatilis Ellin345]|uniref:Pyridoxal-dependent decarboxylase n=1 Tax=Koribacter versatilis (strain Ellin345) TaxID=204669 RepID=Q1IS66_KORVE|nr:pyridoxal-dependent decarboxylase [Candidatus Koribacter versatilis]ABF40284.1 Pyridoxal-dependent decarboxylase [Candidatus Koribacter versatilis Ellin345]
MGFELTRDERQRLGYQLIDRINDFFESLPTRNVQLPANERTFSPLAEPMPELGDDATRVLDDLTTELIDRGFHVPAANYFGLMNPTPTYMAVLAEALVSALNPQLASLARSQLASKIENETVRWIGERVGWNSAFDGTFTSGGNEANFSGLALALAHHFPDAIENGVASIGAQPVVYCSAEAHHSLDKSVGLLGLGRKALRRIPINDRIQLDPEKLVKEIDNDRSAGYKPFCVVATAGTTNSGAVDDISALADICEKHNLWLHLDGAYGAAAIFSDKHRDLVRGIERTDSVTIDPHKWLAMPFAAGVILTRHPQALRDAFEVSTPYMPKLANAAMTDNFKVSTQWSRRMNSLKVYLTLKVHGRAAYEELIDRQLQLAKVAADWFEQSDLFELAVPQVLPILNFRLKGVPEQDLAAAHTRIVEEVTRDGQRWISPTMVNGRSVLRMMIISYLTTEEHIRDLQQALVSAARTLPATARS